MNKTAIFLTFSILLITFISQAFETTYDMARVTPIELAAVGRVAAMGELYDSRSDKFLHLSIFKSPLPNTSIISTENRQTKLQYTFTNTLEEKFQTMDISAGLKMSIMSVLFKLEGSGRFFKDTKRSAKSAKASVINSISTEYERISITETYYESIINFDALKKIDATHVVVGIHWGGSVFVSVEDTNIDEQNQQVVQGNLKAKLIKLTSQISGEANVDVYEKDINEMSKFNFEIYGDILPDEVPQNLLDALKFMKNITKSLQSANSGKGKAMKYTLIPVSILRLMLNVSSKINSIINQVDESIVHQCVKLFDDMNRFEQKLNDLVDNVNHYEKYIPSEKTTEIRKLQFEYKIYQAELRKNLSQHLVWVRSGKETTTELQDLIIQAAKHPNSLQNIENNYRNMSPALKSEISFIKYLLKMDVIILDKDQTLQGFLFDYSRNDVYILCYSESDSVIIGKPLDILIDIIEIKKNNKTTDIFAAVNNQVYNLGSESKLKYYRNTKLITENFEETWTTTNDDKTELGSMSFLQNQIGKLHRDPVIPIGFIYTQFPNNLTPQTLWPEFEWMEVTKEYSDYYVKGLKYRELAPIDSILSNKINHFVILTDLEGTEVFLLTHFDDVYVYGYNNLGRLGFGHEKEVKEPTIIPELCGKKVTDIKCGSAHCVALTQTGQIYTFGRSSYGRTGNGNNEIFQKPIKISINNQTITTIDCTAYSSFALTQSGQLFWFGYLNYSSIVYYPTKIVFSPDVKIKSISCGYNHIVALTVDGKAFSWGSNNHGQLGLGHKGYKYRTENSPQIIELNENIKQICTGLSHNLVLTTNGNIYSMGLNYFGEFGIGNKELKNSPQLVLSEQKEICCYRFISMSLDENNKIHIWGEIYIDEVSPILSELTSFQEVVDSYDKLRSSLNPIQLNFGIKIFKRIE